MHASPYQSVLGDAWAKVAAPIRDMHPGTTTVADGRSTVERGGHPLARLAGWVFGFPPQGRDTPVRVRFETDGRVETWTRHFGGRAMKSRQWAGAGAEAGLICEQLGPLVFASALLPDHDRLTLALRRWRVFGLRLPLRLAPQVEAAETAQDGRFGFDIAIRRPWIGLIVRYRGWLRAPDQEAPP